MAADAELAAGTWRETNKCEKKKQKNSCCLYARYLARVTSFVDKVFGLFQRAHERRMRRIRLMSLASGGGGEKAAIS